MAKENIPYHWQDANGKLITRWDSPHHKEILPFHIINIY